MTPLYVSPSQVSTYQVCPKKWAYGTLLGIRSQNVYAALGEAVHTELERWLKDGTPPGEIASAGLHLLPPPKTQGVSVEGDFAFEYQGIWFRGYVDAQFFDEARRIPVVIDHKTTSNFRWAKTEDDLEKDPQAIVYAVRALQEHPQSSAVELAWIYYRTKGPPKAQATITTLSRDFVGQAFEREVLPVAKEILTIRAAFDEEKITIEDVPRNFSGCSQFGGCPYLEQCNPNPNERLIAMAEQTLLEKLKSRAAKDGVQVNAPAEPVTVVKNVPAKVERVTVEAKIEAPAPTEPGPAPTVALYVNCLPIKGIDCVDGADYVRAAHDALCEAEGVAHYRAIDFGKHSGALQTHLNEVLAANLADLGHVYLLKDSFAFYDALPCFEAIADVIVRGL